MTDLILKPEIWFIDRQLDFKPDHFVTATTPLKKESAEWIINTLVGRFTFSGKSHIDEDFETIKLPSFEDPLEATLYELKWS